MLINRHHVQYLIELGQLARGKSARELMPHKDRLDAFLVTLGGAASPTALAAFEARMRTMPADDRPWFAVRLPETGGRLAPRAEPASGPPAAVLVRGQIDDDPDGEEDGNRLPPRDTPTWARLHDALERWDTTEILEWVGPFGWQPPASTLLLVQEPEPGFPVPPSSPTSPAEAASRAAREAEERSLKTLRVVGTTAAVGGAGALLFGLGRALGRAVTTSHHAPTSAKESTS